MKKQINEFKRMQLIAGVITESQYRESINEMTEDEKYDLLYNFVDEKMVEGDRIAEKIISGKLPNKYDDLYAFVDDKMVEGDEDAKRLLRKINKSKANESQMDEAKKKKSSSVSGLITFDQLKQAVFQEYGFEDDEDVIESFKEVNDLGDLVMLLDDLGYNDEEAYEFIIKAILK